MNTTKEELWEQLDETIKLYPECFEFISDYGRMLILNLFWKHLEQREADFKASLREEIENLLKITENELEDNTIEKQAWMEALEKTLQLLDTVKPKTE